MQSNLLAFKNVLVLDDDPAAAGLLASLLVEQNLSATTVVHVSSVDTIKYFAESKVDVLLVDPCISGAPEMGVVSELRSVAPGVPIVVLTNLDDEAVVAKALRDGAQDYLIKSQIDARGLVRALNYAIERKALEEALFVEKERAQVTLRCIGDAVACTNTAGLITFLNPVAENLTGWLSQEALGRPIQDVFRLFRATDHSIIPPPTEAALRLCQTVHLPPGSILARRDEVEIPVEDSAAPIYDRVGLSIGAVMTLRDVSAARASEALLSVSAAELDRQYSLVKRVNAELAAIIHSCPMAIYATDPEGLVTMWSPAAERMSGFSREEALGKFLPIVPDNGIDQAKKLVREVCRGRVISAALLTRVRKDGTAMELSVCAGPLVDETGRTAGALYIAENITEAQIARRKIDHMEADFVATVSHELRTPLTSISGSLGLIAGGALGAVDGPIARLIKIAYENTLRLSRLVNDILDIEKLQSGQVEFRFERVLLDELVSRAIAGVLPYAQKFGVDLRRIDHPSDVMISADPDRIIQAITNLISNAIKFSPKDARVDISIVRAGDEVRIAVRDFGAGIPEEFHTRIFQRFSQADSSSKRENGGSGLGLSIVREIMERHGGSVSFESALRVGSTFHLLFPALETQQHKIPKMEAAPRRKRILVYALDTAKSETICAALQANGFEYITVFTDEQAFASAADAAIIEIPFSGHNLGGFVHRLGRLQNTENLPVMLYCVEHGVSDYLRDSHALPILDWVTELEKFDVLPQAIESGHLPGRPRRKAILYIEDRPAVLRLLRSALSDEFTLVAASTIEIALKSLERRRFDLVIVNFKLLAGLGNDLIPAVVAAAGQPILTITFTGKNSFGKAFQSDSPVSRELGIYPSTLSTAVRSVLSQMNRKTALRVAP